MDTIKIIKTGQEQAVAAWIGYLNEVRIQRAIGAFRQQNTNLKAALDELGNALSQIKLEVIDRNRGGAKGAHGFIAEIAECGIENAKRLIRGKEANCIWINDDGPSDILRAGQEIQMKFSRSGGHLSLKAVMQHLQAYPDYLVKGGIYQIPKDHYERILYYLAIPKEEADKRGTGTGDFSLRQWKEIHEVFESGKLSIKDIEPASMTYDAVQVDTIEGTLDREKDHIRREDQKRRDAVYEKSKPSLGEGAKVAASSAAIEGATAFCIAVGEIRKSGKKITEFEREDWLEIADETGKGTLKGGIRGISIYALTNCNKATPAAVANAVVTASFGVAEQVHQYRNGKISQLQFLENSEMLCLDASVSALSAMIGQAVIPIPILGAVIGNTVGGILYQAAKNNFSEKERCIIEGYLKEIEEYNSYLETELRKIIDELNRNLNSFVELLDKAFDVDIETAFQGSADLAKCMGVPDEEILGTKEQVRAFFMD